VRAACVDKRHAWTGSRNARSVDTGHGQDAAWEEVDRIRGERKKERGKRRPTNMWVLVAVFLF
jgi:hypothetical protein